MVTFNQVDTHTRTLTQINIPGILKSYNSK